MTPVVATVSGRRIDLRDPQPEAFTLEDIAHGLGNVCRFSGQTRQFYSVAQHSIMVAELVPPEARLAALLHDASEAYIQDVPAPLKALLPEYALIEHRIEAAIAVRFGLPDDPAIWRAVKDSDLLAASVEMRDLFDGHFAADLHDRPPIREDDDLRIHRCLPPSEATALLLHLLRSYSRQGGNMGRTNGD